MALSQETMITLNLSLALPWQMHNLVAHNTNTSFPVINIGHKARDFQQTLLELSPVTSLGHRYGEDHMLWMLVTPRYGPGTLLLPRVRQFQSAVLWGALKPSRKIIYSRLRLKELKEGVVFVFLFAFFVVFAVFYLLFGFNMRLRFQIERSEFYTHLISDILVTGDFVSCMIKSFLNFPPG